MVAFRGPHPYEEIEMSQPNDLPTLGYSIVEVAEIIGVCRQTVYKEIDEDRLVTYTVGRRRLVSPDALRQWLRERELATMRGGR
jgi:excisionase family DNA binding protein